MERRKGNGKRSSGGEIKSIDACYGNVDNRKILWIVHYSWKHHLTCTKLTKPISVKAKIVYSYVTFTRWDLLV